MFGGPPPPPSPEELKAQEAVAYQTLYAGLTTCAILYLSPHAVQYLSNLL